ncbi:hypothetical protein ACFQ3L_05415 [Lacticaseibacillus jixianensis]|uniref:Uncharacterized protein n=1 Tax=Lacticaseibacillus jixianensis TaxID=2486012 RepID=A0ABW4B9Z0_9LACO|nr:hypothetical protein [Lacticaseibacillus jixianensis]
MSLLAILLDALAFGSYTLQITNPNLRLIGAVGQGVVTLILLAMTFGYQGKRFGWFNFQTWAHNFTIRYAIIVISLLINAVVLALYVMNLTGTNSLIFR